MGSLGWCRARWGGAVLTKEAGRRRGGLAGDEGDEVLQHDRTTWNEGRSTVEGDDGWGWELTEGGS
jgi:hypothetical protein